MADELNGKKTNPVKVIREKCLDCCCGVASEVKECTVESCPLHPFRMGKNPYRARREMSESQKACLLGRMRKNQNDPILQEENE